MNPLQTSLETLFPIYLGAEGERFLAPSPILYPAGDVHWSMFEHERRCLLARGWVLAAWPGDACTALVTARQSRAVLKDTGGKTAANAEVPPVSLGGGASPAGRWFQSI